MCAEVIYKTSGVSFPGFTHHDVACHHCTDYMYMVYKFTTPKDIQILLTKLVLDNVQGLTPKINIDKSLVIEDPHPTTLNSLDRFRKYNKDTTNLDRVDRMYYSTYPPPHDGNVDSHLTQVFGQIHTEIQENTVPDTFVVGVRQKN